MLGHAAIEHLLKLALAASDADETEVRLAASDEALTRFSRNVIHQNVSETDATLEVRAAIGRRVGTATTNDLSRTGVERAVGMACASARHLPENPDWPGLPEPGESPALTAPAFDDAVAALTDEPDGRAREVADICTATRSAGLHASGAFSTERSEFAVMNSLGLFAYAPSTQADLTFVVEEPGDSASAYAHAAGWRLGQIDFASLKEEAIRRTRLARNPRPAPAGEYPVVLAPYAVLSVLEALVEDGMGALAVQEGRSWMNGRIGRQTLSPLITIVDDAFDPEGFPQAFDVEGVPKRRVPIVVDGVPTSPVYDRLTASREPGRASTGHAQPYDEDWDGPLPENLSMAPGALDESELLRAIDRGLYVSRFWYVNQTSALDGGATGTTRDGVWWIEGGELAYPVATLRFDQELVEALARVIGVGRERRTLAGYYGIHQVPALALESFRFVGS